MVSGRMPKTCQAVACESCRRGAGFPRLSLRSNIFGISTCTNNRWQVFRPASARWGRSLSLRESSIRLSNRRGTGGDDDIAVLALLASQSMRCLVVVSRDARCSTNCGAGTERCARHIRDDDRSIKHMHSPSGSSVWSATIGTAGEIVVANQSRLLT
jgi:hypothetical protein